MGYRNIIIEHERAEIERNGAPIKTKRTEDGGCNSRLAVPLPRPSLDATTLTWYLVMYAGGAAPSLTSFAL